MSNGRTKEAVGFMSLGLSAVLANVNLVINTCQKSGRTPDALPVRAVVS